MRQRARSLLWRAGQLVLIALPVALLGLAGAMYLWQVKLAVEESLPPALRDYARRQAQLEVQVERVRLGWNRILLTYPEVRTLSGERLLRARYLEVRLPADGAPLTIELDRPEVWLQRNRQGIWNIDPLLRQPRPPEPTPFTFRVRAQGGTLYFDDFLPDAPVRATLWAQEFTLSQPRIGQAITLRGVSDALGDVQARALSDGKRWLIEIDAAQVQGARFKPYLPRTEFDLAQATGQVSAQLVYAPDQPLQVQGVAQGVAQGATYRRRPLPWREAAFALAFTESHIGGVVNTRDGSLRVQGVADWSGRAVQVDARAQAVGEDAAALWRLLRDDPPRVQGRYHAQLRVQGALDDLQAQGTVALAQVRTPQGDLRNLRSPVAFAGGQLLLPALSAEYAGRTVQGKLWLDTRPDTPELRLYAQANRLPLQRVPALREAQLSGEADVSLLVYGRLDTPTVEANLRMDALRYANQRIGGLRARVQYADGALTIPLATLQGALGAVYLSGEVRDLTSDNPRFDLSVDANEVDLNLLAQLLGDANGADESLRLDGVGYLTARVRGSLQSPEAVAEAVVFDGRVGDLGAEIAVVNLNLLERELRITQAQILRRAAQLIASGAVQLPETPDQPPRFQLAGDLYEFDLASIPDWLRRELPLTGLASGRFEAQGEPQAWQLRASLYAESLQYDQIVARDNTAQVIVQARDGAVQVDVVSAQARVGDGALLARGQWRSNGQFEAQWLLENAALDALAPYLPVEYRLTGRATVKGEASGTPDTPNVRVQLQGNQIALNGALLGDVEGWAAFEANPSTRYATPAGVILQQGEQEVENPLLKVPPVNRGNRAGAWFGSPREAGETSAGAWFGSPREAGGAFQGALLGSPREAGGTLRRGVEVVQNFPYAEQSGGNLTADFTLRTPDGEARLVLHECDLQRQQVRLTAETSALPIEWLQRVVRAVPDALPPAVAERIETLQGRVQASLSLEGAMREPLAQLRLNAEQLAWRAQSLGSLSLQAEWVGLSSGDAPDADTDLARAVETVRRLRTQRAALQQLRWQAETARLEAQARYTPERLTADLEAAQLPLRWARLWDPSLPEVDGAFDLSLVVDGAPESPELTLSATLSQLNYAGYTVDQILFSQIEVREGAIQTDDALIRMGDYQARLSGRLPFRWLPIAIPDDEPIRIQARLREQPLTILSLVAPIDPARTQGAIDALLEIEGTLAEPQPRGRLTITDGALALQDLRTALQGIGLQVAFDGREARIVQAQARSSEGGSLRIEGGVDLSGEQAVANLTLRADGLTLREPKLPVLEGSAQAVVSGAVQVQGALTEPQVQGALRVQRGFLYLPPELPERTAGEPLPINPRFDLRVDIADEFTLRNPNLDARMEGALQIGGALQAPSLAGEFNLRSGALSLPTARLRIEPDSVARLNYPFTNAAGETIARIELDVRASTSVVAPDFTGDPIRYRVEVDVRGPLDDPERLQLTARSDPPGLSEQRILSLLGRGQVLAAIARGDDPARVFREQLGDILTAQVLPGLLAPLETGIADAFDLEQFTLDYTGLRPASLYLVKNLFDGVGIAYRRGIGVAGNEYQARLFYRLPFRNRLLQRLRVGFGFDHTGNRFVFIEGSLLFR
ncbi:translocation/assembly module TamB domain-containing protein [Synechococcus sp. RC10B2]|uniref:translocation/assembly module TamB domain-containing protein n=1 Tax=Synechococcus sp. RC10B2 TaxID=2964530 RepID=UPI0039C669A7